MTDKVKNWLRRLVVSAYCLPPFAGLLLIFWLWFAPANAGGDPSAGVFFSIFIPYLCLPFALIAYGIAKRRLWTLTVHLFVCIVFMLYWILPAIPTFQVAWRAHLPVHFVIAVSGFAVPAIIHYALARNRGWLFENRIDSKHEMRIALGAAFAYILPLLALTVALSPFILMGLFQKGPEVLKQIENSRWKIIAYHYPGAGVLSNCWESIVYIDKSSFFKSEHVLKGDILLHLDEIEFTDSSLVRITLRNVPDTLFVDLLNPPKPPTD